MNYNIDEIIQMVKDENTLAKEILSNNEVWRPIRDYPNYQISSFGNVRRIRSKKNLKACINTNGYYDFSLYSNLERTHKHPHRLVAETFIPNFDNKLYEYVPISEKKTTGLIKFYHVNKYNHCCKYCTDEWKYNKSFTHECSV